MLSGRPPLGGEILSHDFVEAALLRRAGWGVYLASWIGGSFEEVPGNIPDYARRDRRWAQGSLQHLRLLGMRGLHPLSRGHFVMGAMGYLSSVLWLLMLIGSTAYVVFAEAGVATAFTRELLLLSTSASSIVRPIPSLLWVTVTLLFVPKGLGLVVAMVRQRSRFGGGVRLLVSGLLEGVFAVVIAPVLMVYHTRFVAGILGGHQVAWDGRTRGGSGVSWRLALRETVGCSLLGLAWGGLTLYSSLAFFLWLTPIFLGLMLAAPITRLTSSPTLGRRARSLGLFLTPFETSSLDIEGGRQALARAGMDRKPTGGPVSVPLRGGFVLDRGRRQQGGSATVVPFRTASPPGSFAQKRETTRRNPMKSRRTPGSAPPRTAARTFCSVSANPPPRITHSASTSRFSRSSAVVYG